MFRYSWRRGTTGDRIGPGALAIRIIKTTTQEWSIMTKGTNKLSRLFAALVMAGVASHSFAADTIKIGIAGPKTGPVAEYGTMQFNGAKMAIEQINAKGGV
ncbi:Leucine ABC transporter subunit substrate-binding protein LivK, partial [Pseudomonas syringae pv. solidagae]